MSRAVRAHAHALFVVVAPALLIGVLLFLVGRLIAALLGAIGLSRRERRAAEAARAAMKGALFIVDVPGRKRAPSKAIPTEPHRWRGMTRHWCPRRTCEDLNGEDPRYQRNYDNCIANSPRMNG